MEQEVDQELFDIGSALINSCSADIMLDISEVIPEDAYEIIGNLMGIIMHTILKHPEIKDPMRTVLAVGTVLYTIVQRELQERTVN